MTIRTDPQSGTLILEGRLSIDGAPALRLELMDALAESHPARVHLAGITECDAAALQVLLAAAAAPGAIAWSEPAAALTETALALGLPAGSFGAEAAL